MDNHINTDYLPGSCENSSLPPPQTPSKDELKEYFSKSHPNDCGIFSFVPDEEKEKHMQYLKCLNNETSPPAVIQHTEKPTISKVFDIPPPVKKANRNSVIDEIIEDIDNMGWLIRYQFNFYMRYGIIYIKYNKEYFFNLIYQYGLTKGINLTPAEVSHIDSYVNLHSSEFTGEPDDEHITLFLNGFVDNVTGNMTEFFHDYFPTVYINANYIPFGKLYHPQFDAFLLRLCNGNEILVKRMWEVIGYTISSDNQAKRFFLLIGEKGNNGKSTWLEFLENLFPYTAVSHMSIGNMHGGRFALSELYLKRLNISSDEGYCQLNDEQIGELKRLTGGKDRITCDVKYSPQICFKPSCKLFLASNYDLTASYSANGQAIISRMCKIPFDAVIDDSEKDPYIVNKLLTEKDAIVSEAFKYYLELRKRGYVFTGDDIYDIKYVIPGGDSYSKVTDFCNNYCCFNNETKYTYTDDLYISFKFAYGNIFPDITSFSKCFNKVCENMGHEVTKQRIHTIERNAWAFVGVELK